MDLGGELISSRFTVKDELGWGEIAAGRMIMEPSLGVSEDVDGTGSTGKVSESLEDST